MAQPTSNKYTNVSKRLINTHTGTPMAPGITADISDEDKNNARFQELLADGEIVSGEAPPAEEPSEQPTGQSENQARVTAPEQPRQPTQPTASAQARQNPTPTPSKEA